MTNDSAFEKHYTIAEIARLWRFHPRTVRRLLERELHLVGSRPRHLPALLWRRLHQKLCDER